MADTHLDKYAKYALAFKHYKESERFVEPNGEDWETRIWDNIIQDDNLLTYNKFIEACNLEDEDGGKKVDKEL